MYGKCLERGGVTAGTEQEFGGVHTACVVDVKHE